jgi:cyclophilin family peptidyl-prolyl cis-trans isomerase
MRRGAIAAVVLALVACLVVACGSSASLKPTKAPKPPTQAPPSLSGAAPSRPDVSPMANPPAQPAGDGTTVTLHTQLGDIVIELYNQSSPVAATNFESLAASGFYNGTIFHRIVPGFVIQGGDPTGTGTGGPGYTIPDEPVVGEYGRGIVAMARTPQPNSEGSQFFIVLDDSARQALDSARTYAIFGNVTQGMAVVDKIAATPNSGPPNNTALQPTTIVSATVQRP